MIMKHELSEAIPILTHLLKEDNLILFAGSGISRNSDIPDWDGLLKSFIDMAESLPITDKKNEKELKKIVEDSRLSFSKGISNNAIRIATVLKNKILECDINKNENKLAKSKYLSWVTNTFANKTPNINHHAIVNTKYPFILTTNYDLLFEEAAARDGINSLLENTYTFKQELEIMSAIHKKVQSIIHIHGSIENLSINELIFTKEDYNNIILKEYGGFSFALRMLFTRYSTLFVGYGASDPHLEEIPEELTHFFPLVDDTKYPLPHSYLVTKRDKADSVLEKWKDRVRTDLIVIDDFKQYDELLEQLKKEVPRK